MRAVGGHRPPLQCKREWASVLAGSLITTGPSTNQDDGRITAARPIRWALALAVGVFLVVGGWLLLRSLEVNQGHFVYPLDDAYIHMAIAKHWVCDGIFGITKYEFTPATSSPLWIVLLTAVFRVGGVQELALLVINLLCALGLLVLCASLLRRHLSSESVIAAGLLGVIFLMPLLPALFSGMEHIFHTALVLALCYVASLLLAAPVGSADRRCVALLWSLGFLATATRFETLFVVAVAGGFLLLRRRWLAALGLIACAVLPVLLMGFYSVQHGGYWLPNSLMTKGEFPKFDSALNILLALGGRSLAKLVTADWHLLGLAVLVVVLLLIRWQRERNLAVPDWMGLLFLPVLLLHCQFAQTGWFYRYEAYLVTFGLMVALLLGAGLWSAGSRRQAVLLFVLTAFCLSPSLIRANIAFRQTVPAMQNVYHQHIQMMRFLKTFYDHETVVINDVGAITFFTDVRCLDTGGLINTEIVRLMHSRTWTPERLRELVTARKARIAIVYPELLPGPMPDWIPVATWRIANNAICAYDTVYVCALNPAEVPRLRTALRLFAIEQRVPVQEKLAADVLPPQPRVAR
jgi:hypothetical protein